MAEVELLQPEELHEHSVSHFSRRVALVTAIFAVVLAIAALGNHAMKEMVLAQQQSSDHWAFCQAFLPGGHH